MCREATPPCGSPLCSEFVMVLALLGQSSWQFPVFFIYCQPHKAGHKPKLSGNKKSLLCLLFGSPANRPQTAVSRTGKPANQSCCTLAAGLVPHPSPARLWPQLAAASRNALDNSKLNGNLKGIKNPWKNNDFLIKKVCGTLPPSVGIKARNSPWFGWMLIFYNHCL